MTMQREAVSASWRQASLVNAQRGGWQDEKGDEAVEGRGRLDSIR